ncbi:MAG TPA: hypothetical protein VM425_12990 [Myxococcota bacterium]|nr:hypothetical protein [Myxococcota bacterium]
MGSRICYALRCTNDGLCPSGWEMVAGSRACRVSTCPQDWKPAEKSLICRYDPCSDRGLFPGPCGMTASCVECFLDEHCGDTLICNEIGECVLPDCEYDSECIGEEACVDRRCVKPCSEGKTCPETEKCNPYGYCLKIRCNSEGQCPGDEYKPIAASLLCHHK